MYILHIPEERDYNEPVQIGHESDWFGFQFRLDWVSRLGMTAGLSVNLVWSARAVSISSIIL